MNLEDIKHIFLKRLKVAKIDAICGEREREREWKGCGFHALFGRWRWRSWWCALWFPPISSRGAGPSMKYVHIAQRVCTYLGEHSL